MSKFITFEGVDGAGKTIQLMFFWHYGQTSRQADVVQSSPIVCRSGFNPTYRSKACPETAGRPDPHLMDNLDSKEVRPCWLLKRRHPLPTIALSYRMRRCLPMPSAPASS